MVLEIAVASQKQRAALSAEGNSGKSLKLATFQGSALCGPSFVASLCCNLPANTIQIHIGAENEKSFCALRLTLI